MWEFLTLALIDTDSYPIWDLYLFLLYVETIFSGTCHVSGLWISNIPRYFYLVLQSHVSKLEFKVDTFSANLSLNLFFFLRKFNDDMHCIGTEECICTTICKQTSSYGLRWILEKYVVILTKSSSSCFYMLSLSYFFVVLIFSNVRYIDI